MRVGALLATTISWAYLAAPSAQGTEWQFSYSSAAPMALPNWIHADSLRSALSYMRGEVMAGFVADINQDGRDDYVFRFSRSVCGTNCEYVLIDGRTQRRIGSVGGTVMVVRSPTVNGYPTIHSYGHSSVDSGYWSTSVYDGQKYVAVGTVHVEGASQKKLFESLEKIPHWPRRNH